MSDGMIDARIVRSGIYGTIGAAFNLEITPRGRALTPERPIHLKTTPKVAMPKEDLLFDVFVSHATEDKAYVEPLVEALKAAGIRVWLRQTDSGVGRRPETVDRSWAGELSLRHCRLF
jgi:hypothetical protein